MMHLNQPKQNQFFSLIALCLGFFMVIVDVMIVNVALPSIEKELQGTIASLQWVVDGYALTFACLLLAAGSLGDRIGAKKLFLFGLLLFVATSLGCGLAANFTWLILFRLFQGAAAAFLVPTSLALINASYENKEERAHAIGIWGGLGGVAASVAPVLGAFLTSAFTWRAIFFVNIPVGLLAWWLTLRYVPNPSTKPDPFKFDFLGQFFSILSLAALAFSLIEAGRLGWFSEVILITFGIFLISFLAFIYLELRSSAPMFPLQFFQSKTFSTTIAIGMILNFSAYGILFLLPLYFQQVRSYSVLMTGFALLPIGIMAAVGSYYGGKWTSSLGHKLPIIMGLLIGAVGLLILFFIMNEDSSYLILFLPLLSIGLGPSFTMPATTIAAINSIPEERSGLAAGAFNTSRQIGSLIGVAIFGTIVSTAINFTSGMQIALFLSFLAYASTALVALCLL